MARHSINLAVARNAIPANVAGSIALAALEFARLGLAVKAEVIVVAAKGAIDWVSAFTVG